MHLMQKYDKEDGAIGVDDLARWPMGSVAVDFLSTSGAAASMEVLRMVSRFVQAWSLLTPVSIR